jgi:hypothetical protein
MKPEYAISLVNVIAEAYGMRSRKGYTEWANNIPGSGEIGTMLSYYPATAVPVPAALPAQMDVARTMIVSRASKAGPPPGTLFAARDNSLYDVTAGGPGPWTAEAVVNGGSPLWYGVNYQNVAGSFLVICNDAGGYAIYDGTDWAMPIAGDGTAGTISGVDPADLAFVTTWKKRLWFIENDSTRAYYLPVGQITGIVKEFDFGEQFKHGGKLAALASWTVDGGDGMDDHLVGVSSQGDVVIYKGNDPDIAEAFQVHGSWYVGPLPAGRRQVTAWGGDVHILSQFGMVPVSKLLTATSISAEAQMNLTHLIDPFIARLMQDYAGLRGWSILDGSKEELVLVGIPKEAAKFGGQFLAFKTTTQSWTRFSGTTYTHIINIGQLMYAGTTDGRVVRAFDGPLDNVLIGANAGQAIPCQVTPAYQSMGSPALQKRFILVRPSFLSTVTPKLTMQILTDYGAPKPPIVPTLPEILQSRWDEALWDQDVWSGIQEPIREWLGATGKGFAATAQLDYSCGGDTILTAIDFWTEEGGVL